MSYEARNGPAAPIDETATRLRREPIRRTNQACQTAMLPGVSFARVSATSRVRAYWTRKRADFATIIVVALLVGLPGLLSRGFTPDFVNHQWLVWVQDHAITAHGGPSYFLHTGEGGGTGGGVFDPFFLFYGGTLYAIAGALSMLAGHRTGVAFEAITVLSVAAAYGGIVWLARQLGVRSWMAHAPAVTFVASAYYVTNLYGRGAWSEFVATSALPLMVASGLQIARSQRREAGPCALFAASAILASGSHNITLLWGSITFAVALVALRVALRKPLSVGRRQIAWLVALLGLAVCANAWFLLPALIHAGDTQIADYPIIPWSATYELNTPRMVLSPLRHGLPSSESTPALYVQAPVWLLAWALGALALLRRRVAPVLRRVAVAFAIILAALLALIFEEPLYDRLPRVLAQIQFPYRLNTYVALAIAGLVLVAVLATENAGRRVRRRLAVALALATSITIGFCAWQLFVPETGDFDVDDAFVSPNRTPPTWYNGGAYLDASARVVPFASDRILTINPSGLRGNRATLTLTPPPGRQPFAMTMGAGPEIVELRGLERLGRTPTGFTVARRLDGGSGPVRVTLVVRSTTISVGVWLTRLGVCALGLLAALAALRAARRRHAGARAP